MKREPFANLSAVGERVCVSCGTPFTPRPGGYNAAYCSQACKSRAGYHRAKLRNPDELKAARARSFLSTKGHPDRYLKHLEQGRTARKAVRQWLADYKLAHGCVDCGYKGHFSALQLDHEGPKSVEIANARSSVARLKKEIESGQCKVRCANCHSIRTWERKQAVKGGRK